MAAEGLLRLRPLSAEHLSAAISPTGGGGGGGGEVKKSGFFIGKVHFLFRVAASEHNLRQRLSLTQLTLDDSFSL